MSDDGSSATPATGIAVHLFREILLVPLAIEWHSNKDRLRIGRDLMAVAAEALSGSRWRPVEDRLLHMRTDRSPDAADPAKRAATLAPAYEEFVFFEPYVQRFLYGSSAGGRGRPPMRLFARDDVEGLEIGLSGQDPPPDEAVPTPDGGSGDKTGLLHFCFRVQRCNLYLLDTGNALLVVEIEHDPEVGGTPLTLAHAQRLLESVRRVFPPYFMAARDGSGLEAPYFPASFRWRLAGGEHATKSHGTPTADAIIEQVLGPADAPRGKARHPPMSEPWRALLEPLHVEGYAPEIRVRPEVVLGQTGDDRAFVLAQIGVPHPDRIARSDWVRLCFADSPGDGFPYGPSLLDGFEKQHCYDRFWDEAPGDWKKVRYLVCGYAMVVVGQDDGTNGRSPSFFRAILSKHLQRHYFQLVLIACFQKAALLTLSERLALALEAEDDRSPRFRDAVHAMARESRHFTHRYWFEDISAQVQAGELFSLLRDHLRTRALYDQVVSELGEADRSLIADEQGEVSEHQERLNVIAGVGLVLAVTAGIFGMNVFAPGTELFGSVELWQMFAWGAGTGFAFCMIGLLWRLRPARALFRWIVPIGLAIATIAAILFGAYAT